MRHFCSVGVLFLSLVAAASPAQACRDDDLVSVVDDVKSADLVVAGRIANYVVVANTRGRVAHERSEQPAKAKKPNYLTSEYARFDILVDEVLVGRAAKTLTVTLDYPMYRELEFMLPGPYLIALRDPRSPRTGGYTPNPSPILMTVLQDGCSPAFIFEISSKEAAEARRILSSTAK